MTLAPLMGLAGALWIECGRLTEKRPLANPQSRKGKNLRSDAAANDPGPQANPAFPVLAFLSGLSGLARGMLLIRVWGLTEKRSLAEPQSPLRGCAAAKVGGQLLRILSIELVHASH